MRERLRVPPEYVTIHTDPALLPDEPRDSSGLFELLGPIARRALDLGLAAREPSFHVFVAAAPEVMIEDDVVRHAERMLARRGGAPLGGDVVYVHDFAHPEAPRPLRLPAGGARRLRGAMEQAIAAMRERMGELGETEELREAADHLAKELEGSNKQVLSSLETTAKTLGFGVRTIQGGVQTFPILHGKPLSAEQFEALDESTKRALHQGEQRLTQEVERAAGTVRENTARFAAARNQALSIVARAIVDDVLDETVGGCADLGDEVRKYLDQVREALHEDWEDLALEGEDSEGNEKNDETGDVDPEHAQRLQRFRVNVFVERPEGAPPPVIYETNPTYPLLFGYLERRARFGALLTDFARIRAGSLQRASGGVLIVRAADVLTDPIIWERLKRVLRERRIGAEDPLGPLGLYATSLRPVPTPINVRVVLVGPHELYAALLANDPDFAALFRVKVEVEASIPRTTENLLRLDAYLMGMAKEREWGRFDRAARARLLDLATRLAGDRERLALILSPLEETAAFASALAAARALEAPPDADVPALSGNEPRLRPSAPPPAMSVIGADDIDVAWRERRERTGAAERTFRELTLRGEVTVETSGARVGVVNGLSVLSVGDVEFGQPMRITAIVAIGREGLVDVEREAQLGGAIHTKGVAILRGYLGRIFGQERPLSLRAQIAFEQSYGEVDGDSASCAELLAVLSALADVPIDQSLSITASVNQLGELQTIGGLCAKIEGFFDLCLARGLTGGQGVVIPKPNLPHLVLREDVVKAIAEGRFHLHAASTVEEAVEVLTGVDAGMRDEHGRFPAASVFGRVERRVIEIAERLRVAEGHGPAEVAGEDPGSETDLGDPTDFRVR